MLGLRHASAVFTDSMRKLFVLAYSALNMQLERGSANSDSEEPTAWQCQLSIVQCVALITLYVAGSTRCAHAQQLLVGVSMEMGTLQVKP